jgi:hypothetical protein
MLQRREKPCLTRVIVFFQYGIKVRDMIQKRQLKCQSRIVLDGIPCTISFRLIKASTTPSGFAVRVAIEARLNSASKPPRARLKPPGTIGLPTTRSGTRHVPDAGP